MEIAKGTEHYLLIKKLSFLPRTPIEDSLGVGRVRVAI